MTTPKPDLYVFCWEDAHHEHEDVAGNEPAACYDVGWVVEEDEKTVRIASQWTPPGRKWGESYRFCLTVPKSLVRWRRKLPWALDKRGELG